MDIEVTETMNAYPQWAEDFTLSPARVSENAPVNTIVKRLKATSSIPDSLVNYVIQPGETLEQNGQPRSFYCKIDESRNEMIVLTYRPLDYETVPQYTLTIKAAVRRVLLADFIDRGSKQCIYDCTFWDRDSKFSTFSDLRTY